MQQTTPRHAIALKETAGLSKGARDIAARDASTSGDEAL